jgi:hypothetical protein
MEWVDGEDLATRLERGPLSTAEALNVVRTIASGLAIAHARGMTHRGHQPEQHLARGARYSAVEAR